MRALRQYVCLPVGELPLLRNAILHLENFYRKIFLAPFLLKSGNRVDWEKTSRGIAVNNAAITTMHTMLRVRLHADEQTSCLQTAGSTLAAEAAANTLKVLHDVVGDHRQNVRDVLEKTMENLQDILVVGVRDTLAACGVSADERIVIRLSPEGQLCVEGEGGVAQSVQNSLDANPLLNSIFCQIQARAMILQALDNVKVGLDVCLELGGQELLSQTVVYKMCIKGTLSHFYMQ